MSMGDGTNANESKQVVVDNNVKLVDDDECRICFESLADDDRTPVMLRCGHPYHLHCIGSAFNVTNKMQCPTCKRVEQSEWLFARSTPTLPSFNMPMVRPLMPIVQPLMGDVRIPALVRRRSELSSLGRQLGRILPDPTRSTFSSRFNVPLRESSMEMTTQQQIAAKPSRIREESSLGMTPQQQQIAANVSRTRQSPLEMTTQQQVAANISRTLSGKRVKYDYDTRSSGGEDEATTAVEKVAEVEEVVQKGRQNLMTKTRATTSLGETSRTGGSKQFRPTHGISTIY